MAGSGSGGSSGSGSGAGSGSGSGKSGSGSGYSGSRVSSGMSYSGKGSYSGYKGGAEGGSCNKGDAKEVYSKGVLLSEYLSGKGSLLYGSFRPQDFYRNGRQQPGKQSLYEPASFRYHTLAGMDSNERAAKAPCGKVGISCLVCGKCFAGKN